MKKSFIYKIFAFLLVVNLTAFGAKKDESKVEQEVSFFQKAKNIITNKKVLMCGAAAAAGGVAYFLCPESVKNFFNPNHLYKHGSLTKEITVDLVGDSLESAIGKTLKETVPSFAQNVINIDNIAASTTQKIVGSFSFDIALPVAPLNYLRKTLFSGVINSKTVQFGISVLAGGVAAYGVNKVKNVVQSIADLPEKCTRENIKKACWVGIPAVIAGGVIGCIVFKKYPEFLKDFCNPNHVIDDIKTEAVFKFTKRSLEEFIFTNLKQNVPKSVACMMEKYSKATLQEIASKTAEKVSQLGVDVAVKVPMKAVNTARQSLFGGCVNGKNIRMATSLVVGAAITCGVSMLASSCYDVVTSNSKKVKKALMYSAPLAVAAIAGYGLYNYFPLGITAAMNTNVANIATGCTIPANWISDRLAGSRGIECAINVSSAPINALREMVCSPDKVRMATALVGGSLAGYATTYLKKPAERLFGYFSGNKTEGQK
ncbi:hypothetical protein KC460_04570 [Candidatus Dependentiae bacterium]|nr:hypothetical protein [Candidatus Dependentiae bacterium]